MLKRIISYIVCSITLITSSLISIPVYATTIGQDVRYNLPINSGMDEVSDAAYIDNQLGVTGDASLCQDRKYGNYSVKVTLESNTGEATYTLVNSEAFTINDYSQVEIWIKPSRGSEWIEFSTTNSSAKRYEVGNVITRGKWNCITLDLTEIQGSFTQGEDLKIKSNDTSVWYFDEIKSVETKIYSFDLLDMTDSKTEINNGGLQFKTNSTSTFETSPTILKSDELSISELKEISKITISREYADTSGDLSELPRDALYLSNLTSMPTNFVISGNGNMLYYVDPSDLKKIHQLDLMTGADDFFSVSYEVEEIKVTDEGDYLAIMTDYDNRVYRYSEASSSVTYVDSDVSGYDIQNNGDVFYYETNADEFYVYNGSSSVSIYDTTISVESFQTNGDDEVIYFYVLDRYSEKDYVYKLENTMAYGWQVSYVYEDFDDVEKLIATNDGRQIYLENGGKPYLYNVDNEALRKLPIDNDNNIYEFSDDDRLMGKKYNGSYFLYNTDTDKKEELEINDIGSDLNFADSGKYIAYISDDFGIKVRKLEELSEPEKYLLSFDGKQSWYGFNNGSWIKASHASTPSEEDFSKFGMTATEVNNLDKGDYGKLYKEFENVYSVSVSSYFASVDCFTTPSIKSIKVTTCNDVADYDRYKTKANLYTAKKKDFDGTNWRNVKKVYPVEISKQNADFRYFISINGEYIVYKDTSWQTVTGAATYLSDVETNWIDITIEGMSTEELRSIPEDDLTSELAGEIFSIVYALKVCDDATHDYLSMIHMDYSENIFSITGMTLSITLYGNGTPLQYTHLTDEQIEDFMAWIYSRQYNVGPTFYRIDTGATSEFINYDMIQKISVTDE